MCHMQMQASKPSRVCWYVGVGDNEKGDDAGIHKMYQIRRMYQGYLDGDGHHLKMAVGDIPMFAKS